MKKLIILLLIILFGAVSIQAQGIKRVPKNSTKDSTKTESIVNQNDKAPEIKESPKQDSFNSPRKDEFIDKDGDGINDQMTQSKPPAVKKQPPPTQKEPEIKPQPAPQKQPPPTSKAPEVKSQPVPQKQPPPPPKTENKEKDEKSSEKKSRR